MSKNKIDVANVDSTKVAVESNTELTDRERVKALLTLSAVNIYCKATGRNEDDVNATLAKVEKSKFTYWVYTTPTLGENSKGEIITAEKWEKANPDAVRVDILDKVQWYKKPVFLDDASVVVRIISSYERYAAARENGLKRLVAALMKDMGDAFLAGDIAKAEEIRAKIQEITTK